MQLPGCGGEGKVPGVLAQTGKPVGLQWNWSYRSHRPQLGMLLGQAGQRRDSGLFFILDLLGY